jgi:hypothetical protein
MTCTNIIYVKVDRIKQRFGDGNQGVFTLEVGDLDALGRLISRASADPGVFRSCREAAKKRAGEFTWSKFRQKVAAALYSLST